MGGPSRPEARVAIVLFASYKCANIVVVKIVVTQTSSYICKYVEGLLAFAPIVLSARKANVSPQIVDMSMYICIVVVVIGRLCSPLCYLCIYAQCLLLLFCNYYYRPMQKFMFAFFYGDFCLCECECVCVCVIICPCAQFDIVEKL